ncbi:hypothetical protein [Hymenobacter koreensis]|uniref:Uncharacterized protein n=1 Tax=Hymenobacter koreensis TaxID=1084523 RepID=A0ABP8JN21_9BACT
MPCASPKPAVIAHKRKPCGKEKTAGSRKPVAPVATVTPWYKEPMGSPAYKAGEAQYFAGKQRTTIIDQCGRPATVYSNPIR